VGSIPTASTNSVTRTPRMDANSSTAVLFDFGGMLDADGLAWKERVYRLFRDEGVAVERERFDPLFHAADDALGHLGDNTPLLRRLARHARLGIVSNFYGNLVRVCDDAGIPAAEATG